MKTDTQSRHHRSIHLILAAAVALVAALPGNAQQNRPRGLVGSAAPLYLALGDSYPHGSDGSDYFPNNDNYWVGYPQILQQLIDRPLINAGCPGETTASFLGDVVSSRCLGFKEAGLLHVDYAGSQIGFAEDYLTSHDRVKLVTLQLGGNDFQNAARSCGTGATCMGALAAELVYNFDRILARIRGTGYDGQIIVVEYPSTKSTGSTAAAFKALYDAIRPTVEAYDAELAPVFDRFKQAAVPYSGNTCAAGLTIINPDSTCNIHPTASGHLLIASVLFEMVSTSGPLAR